MVESVPFFIRPGASKKKSGAGKNRLAPQHWYQQYT